MKSKRTYSDDVDMMLDLARDVASRLHALGIERTSGQVIKYYSDYLERNGKRSRPRTIIYLLTANLQEEALLKALGYEMAKPDTRIYSSPAARYKRR